MGPGGDAAGGDDAGVGASTATVTDVALVAELELAGAPALPALARSEVHGWLVRRSLGQMGRPNTVLPIRFDGGDADLDAAIDDVERLSRAAGVVPGFQMSIAVQPPRLDDVLAGRGYERLPGALVMARSLACWPAPSPAPAAGELVVTEHATLDGAWLDVHDAGSGDTPVRRAELEGCLGQITAPALYVRVTDAGGAGLGVGRGVLSGPSGRWLGIMSMATVPSARRRGVARLVLDRLVAWAGANHATDAYLQVAPDNHGAITLYRSVGFVTIYDYWRRTLPGAQRQECP